jgi:cytochrome c-type biogenesis protein CcmH
MTAAIKSRIRRMAAGGCVVALAVFVVAIPPSRAQASDHAKQLGLKLMCICGCGQVLIGCNHIGCPSSVPMLKELEQHISRGEADDLVVQDFVQEYGMQVLSEPPNSGFNRVAWLLPGFVFSLGLGIVAFVIARWRRKVVVVAPAPQRASAEVLKRAREMADRDTDE